MQVTNRGDANTAFRIIGGNVQILDAFLETLGEQNITSSDGTINSGSGVGEWTFDVGSLGTSVYRLNLADAGGDGWQGASYRVYNASGYPDITMTPSSMVANGTLASGFSSVDWLCLADGCYEIAVDGGAADSEIGFEFVDEAGGHFQDFSAPYADHMCVSGGDVFDHPTASPTALPTALPSAFPTAQPTPAPTAAPVPSPTVRPTTIPTALPTTPPTALPTFVPVPQPTVTHAPTTSTPYPTLPPTPLPTPTPTRTPLLALTVELAGVDCVEFDSSVYGPALEDTLPGASFDEHLCESAGTNGSTPLVSIATELTLPCLGYLLHKSYPDGLPQLLRMRRSQLHAPEVLRL